MLIHRLTAWVIGEMLADELDDLGAHVHSVKRQGQGIDVRASGKDGRGIDIHVTADDDAMHLSATFARGTGVFFDGVDWDPTRLGRLRRLLVAAAR